MIEHSPLSPVGAHALSMTKGNCYTQGKRAMKLTNLHCYPKILLHLMTSGKDDLYKSTYYGILLEDVKFSESQEYQYNHKFNE